MPDSEDRDDTGDRDHAEDGDHTANGDDSGGRVVGSPAPGDEPRFRVRTVVRPSAGDEDARVESADETAEGWGEAPDRRGDDWYRRERPPHHGS